MHQENPDTFDVPSANHLKLIQPGKYVKVSNGKERFWIEVIEKKTRGYYTGIIMNKLLFYTSYTLGDLVQFHRRHVYDILDQESRQS